MRSSRQHASSVLFLAMLARISRCGMATLTEAALSSCAARSKLFPAIMHNFTMTPHGANEVALSETCKTIHFVRHAEGIHNVASREMPGFHDGPSRTMVYHDAPLTSVGVGQGQALRIKVEGLAAPPEVVVVSPLRRAIHTAQLGFQSSAGHGPPFVCTELCRERISIHASDMRRDLSTISGEFPFVDFGEVVDEADAMWPHKEILPSEDASEACAARALDFLAWLHARPEQRLAVVSHWVFYTHLFALFGDDALGEKFGNAEMRSVVLCLRGGET